MIDASAGDYLTVSELNIESDTCTDMCEDATHDEPVRINCVFGGIECMQAVEVNIAAQPLSNFCENVLRQMGRLLRDHVWCDWNDGRRRLALPVKLLTRRQRSNATYVKCSGTPLCQDV